MRLIRNISLYTLIQFLQKGVSFFSLPLYTAIIMPYGLGVYNEILAFASFFILFFGLGLDESAAKFYFDSDNYNQKQRILGTIVIMSLITALIGVFVLLGVNLLWSDLFLSDIPDSLIYSSFILILVTPIVNVYTKILRIDERVLRYSILTLFHSVGHVILTLLLLNFTTLGYKSLIYSSVIIALILFVMSLYGMIGLKFTFDRSFIRTALFFSLPLTPHKFFGWGLLSFTILALGRYSGSDAVGLFIAMAYISVVIDFFGKAFFNALQPWIYGLLKNGSDTKIIEDTFRLLGLLAVLVEGILLLWGEEFLKLIIADTYELDGLIINCLTFSSVLMFIGSMTVFVLYYEKRTVKYTSISTVVGVILNITLSLLLIPILGLKGACISLIVANLFISLLKVYFVGKRLKNLQLMNVILFSCIVFLCVYLLEEMLDRYLSVKIVISFIYSIAFIPSINKHMKFLNLL